MKIKRLHDISLEMAEKTLAMRMVHVFSTLILHWRPEIGRTNEQSLL